MEIESNSTNNMVEEQMELPPGFRFHPTDEELITHYLSEKVLDTNFKTIVIGEADLNTTEPWDLPKQAKMGEKEWYFFVVRDRKYPTGLRTNRATEAGYWKATGKDKEIYREKTLVGMKKTLVFYTGRAPKGEKTNWVMHEYRLEGKYSKYKDSKNDWVISRVFNKNSAAKTPNTASQTVSLETSLPPLMDSSPYSNTSETTIAAAATTSSHVNCFSSTCLLDDNKVKKPDNQEQENHVNGMVNTPFSPLLFGCDCSQFTDSFLTQDQSMLKLLLEGKMINNNSGFEGMVDESSGFLNQEIISHDSFWDY
ncbi:unnamed protein product [Amaranthus hypochondriacus]